MTVVNLFRSSSQQRGLLWLVIKELAIDIVNVFELRQVLSLNSLLTLAIS